MKRQNYIAPEIEVLEIKIEQGFALSNGETTPTDDLPSFGNGGW